MCVADQSDKVLFKRKAKSDSAAFARAILKQASDAERIGFETGAMALARDCRDLKNPLHILLTEVGPLFPRTIRGSFCAEALRLL